MHPVVWKFADDDKKHSVPQAFLVIKDMSGDCHHLTITINVILTQVQLSHKYQDCSFELRQTTLVEHHHQLHLQSPHSIQGSYSLECPCLLICYLQLMPSNIYDAHLLGTHMLLEDD